MALLFLCFCWRDVAHSCVTRTPYSLSKRFVSMATTWSCSYHVCKERKRVAFLMSMLLLLSVSCSAWGEHQVDSCLSGPAQFQRQVVPSQPVWYSRWESLYVVCVAVNVCVCLFVYGTLKCGLFPIIMSSGPLTLNRIGSIPSYRIAPNFCSTKISLEIL